MNVQSVFVKILLGTVEKNTMDIKKPRPAKCVAILEATLELIADHGFHNTPTSQIAHKAKVGVGSIYRYFADKDDLIHELFLYVLEKETHEVLQRHNSSSPLREQYIHICTGIIQFALNHPEEANFLQQFRHSPYGRTLGPAEMLKKDPEQIKNPPLFVLFETAIAQQVIKDLPPPILGALTLGPIFELARDINSRLLPHTPELVRMVVDACWDAIKR